MKFFHRTTTLSVATLACLAASLTWADQPRGLVARQPMQGGVAAGEPEPAVSPQAPQRDGEPLLGEEAWDAAGGESCCSADSWSCGRSRGGLWYGSVDYLLVRPRFSQSIAEIRTTQTTSGTAVPSTSTLTEQAVQFPFTYNSAFRTALGYRMLDCGGDIQLAYWRLTGNAQLSDSPGNANSNTAIIGNLQNNPAADQTYTTHTGVTANIFDIDFAKCLSLGGPTSPCDACFCPRWDLRWSAGARIADVSRFNNNVVSDASGNGISTADINARFVGAGPRVGLQGRRYFGHTGLLSVYARANQSLLIGDYRMSRVRNTAGETADARIVTQQFDNFSRMVPVTDIELGGTWQVAPYTFISAGYFFQCWWDLGQAETISGTSFGPLSSANILSFDGLFIRGEMLF